MTVIIYLDLLPSLTMSRREGDISSEAECLGSTGYEKSHAVISVSSRVVSPRLELVLVISSLSVDCGIKVEEDVKDVSK